MTAQRILGEPIAAELRQAAKDGASRCLAEKGLAPRLAIVASAAESARIYARKLVKDAEAAGIESELHELAEDASTPAALEIVRRAASSPLVDGILLQTPLPAGVDAEALAAEIPAVKDVDGASRASAGAAAQGSRQAFYPATAAACLELIARVKPEVAGLRALVLGRSAVVGRPVALGLVNRNATVTIAHSKTRDAAALARESDVLVAAVGKLALVEASWIKPGAVVIDVGIHRVVDPAAARALLGGDAVRWGEFERKGSAIVGDCHPGVAAVAGALTPVPGGVGPVTSAILLTHVVRAARGASA
jgi:methylenetetrahydrofolate dehydrogenase (NADP+)/methenyltetrahydrofolate cyclohydrolase